MLTLDKIRSNESAINALRLIPFEFDMIDFDPEDGDSISFGTAIEFTVIAGDYCGGVYLLCGKDPSLQRPVFHVSSDAKATRLGNNLTEALEHVIAMPTWMDLAHADTARMKQLANVYNRDSDDEWKQNRDRIAELLGIDVATDHTLRLHSAIKAGIKTKVLINGNPTINGFGTNWDEL